MSVNSFRDGSQWPAIFSSTPEDFVSKNLFHNVMVWYEFLQLPAGTLYKKIGRREFCYVAVGSISQLMLVYRSSKRSNVELELLTSTDGQQTVRMFTIMFSSLGAADEFKNLFKQVRGCIIRSFSR